MQYYDTWGKPSSGSRSSRRGDGRGPGALGSFIELVQPFSYRKYLDHAALEEIFRYKERAEKSHSDVDQDVKVGPGGIREIEVVHNKPCN